MSAAQFFKSGDTIRYFFSNLVLIPVNTLPGIFNNTHLKDVNSSLWTIHYEVSYYFYMLCALTLLRKKIVIYNVVLLLIVVDAFFHLHIFSHSPRTEVNLLPICFAVGSFVAVNQNKIKIGNLLFIASVCITAALWKTSVNEIMFLITTFIFVLLINTSSYVRQIKIKHDISYGIYLWGFFIQQIIKSSFPSINFYLFMVVSLVLSMVAGYVSYVLIEKRFMAYGKKLDQKFANRKASNVT